MVLHPCLPCVFCFAGIWTTKIHATFLKRQTRQLTTKAESSGEEPIDDVKPNLKFLLFFDACYHLLLYCNRSKTFFLFQKVQIIEKKERREEKHVRVTWHFCVFYKLFFFFCFHFSCFLKQQANILQLAFIKVKNGHKMH